MRIKSSATIRLELEKLEPSSPFHWIVELWKQWMAMTRFNIQNTSLWKVFKLHASQPFFSFRRPFLQEKQEPATWGTDDFSPSRHQGVDSHRWPWIHGHCLWWNLVSTGRMPSTCSFCSDTSVGFRAAVRRSLGESRPRQGRAEENFFSCRH